MCAKASKTLIARGYVRGINADYCNAETNAINALTVLSTSLEIFDRLGRLLLGERVKEPQKIPKGLIGVEVWLSRTSGFAAADKCAIIKANNFTKKSMVSLQDIIDLANKDQGKFFVMDETGDIKLVILPVEDFKRLAAAQPARKQVPAVDSEKINREILQAQLSEPEVPVPAAVLASAIAESRKSLPPRVDMREEVIDPSFDFEGPKANLEDI